MKLQRFKVLLDGDFPCPSIQDMENGDILPLQSLEIVMAEDVGALEGENERLKAPPKVLSAEEVTEPGFYWHNLGPKNNDWLIDRVVRYGVLDDLHIMNAFGGYYPLKHMHGPQFIGPLTPPEM